MVLVQMASKPIKMKPVPAENHYTSTRRAEKLQRYGGRLVASVGRGDNSEANSFGTVIEEWREFLDEGETLSGDNLRDHILNGRKFVQDCLSLAADHGKAMQRDTNPTGAVLASFVPAGAAPFDDLDRHRRAHEQVDSICASFPNMASKMGNGQTELDAPGEEKAPSPAAPKPTGLTKADKRKATAEAATAGKAKKVKVDPKDAAKKAEAAAAHKAAELSAAEKHSRLIAVEGGTKTPSVSEIAKACKVKAKDYCWEVVCHPSEDAEERHELCPCPDESGHRGAGAPRHRVPAKLADAYQSLFGRPPLA